MNKMKKDRKGKRKNKLIAPVLKWVGGKRQLIPAIKSYFPPRYKTYCEPFIGGGALLFYFQPQKAMINDLNEELINVYSVIKNNIEDLIKDLKRHKNESDYFYKIRALDRSDAFNHLSKIEKASRVIFLNKTCYNGLYRVNSLGEFNSPFGGYKNPNIVNEATIRAVSHYFNQNEITILNKDFEEALNEVGKDDFVYLDPPYHPVSKSSSFTGYNKVDFDETEQVRLSNLCHALNNKDIKFLLSNSATSFIKDLYKNFHINYVKANRAVNSNGQKRGEVDEVLIKNYE